MLQLGVPRITGAQDMMDPLLISDLPPCWAAFCGGDLLRMVMNEANGSGLPYALYTTFIDLAHFNVAYQTHRSGNALRSVTIKVLTTQAESLQTPDPLLFQTK